MAPTPSPTRRPLAVRPLLITLLGLLILTFLEFRVVWLIQFDRLPAQRDSALGVLTGHPDWRLYQSRLLGPALVGALAHLTHRPFAACYALVCRALLLLANAA